MDRPVRGSITSKRTDRDEAIGTESKKKQYCCLSACEEHARLTDYTDGTMG